MKRNLLFRALLVAALVAGLLLQGCEKKVPVSESVSETSVSKNDEASTATEKPETEQTSAEETQEASGIPERTENIVTRLVQQEVPDPMVIDVYNDGTFKYYVAGHLEINEYMQGYWEFRGDELCLADTDIDELLVNSLKLTDDGFVYEALDCAGFAYGDVPDNAVFKDEAGTPTQAEMEEYQLSLGGAPFHARIPSLYAVADGRYLGFWEDIESGWYEITVTKASAEIGGYTINVGNVDGECLIYGDAHIDGDRLVVHQINNTNLSADVYLEPKGEGILLHCEGEINLGNPNVAGPYYFDKEFKR